MLTFLLNSFSSVLYKESNLSSNLAGGVSENWLGVYRSKSFPTEEIDLLGVVYSMSKSEFKNKYYWICFLGTNCLNSICRPFKILICD